MTETINWEAYMQENPNDPVVRWMKSMIESDGCVHENETYAEGDRLYLICKKCDKSWPV